MSLLQMYYLTYNYVYSVVTVLSELGRKGKPLIFIAFIAILAQFGLSGDPEFVPVGESGIMYAEDFKAYKLMLYKFYDKPSIQEVFQQYNNMIFSNQNDERILV
ncbi:hypothetical protein BDQ17DRAFT_1327078 [Cyathus striatus]|nr:hypothetical protein BDQ17DRAFT_1327078 [Cyathus striatus]